MTSIATPAPTVPTPPPSAWNQLLAEEQTQIHALIAHANASGIGTTEFWLTLLSPPATFVVALFTSWSTTHGLGTFSAVFSPIAASVAAAGAAWAAKEYSAARAVVKSAILDLRGKLGF